MLQRLRTLILLAVVWGACAGWVLCGAAPPPQLRYVVIITRHGVRSPTWTPEHLNQYSTQPWPKWDVPPGNLTAHGRALMKLMGSYYRQWLLGEHLLSQPGCGDASRIYIHADTDQRTMETGRALAESLLPGCAVDVHSAPEGIRDPLFGGSGKPDWEIAAKAVRQRLEEKFGPFQDLHRAAFATLESILVGKGNAPEHPIEPPTGISVSATERGVQLSEPWSLASTLSEDLLLEYTEGMQGNDLGWGRLDADALLRVLELHAVYENLMRRTPELARARGSNLVEHVLRSIKQAVSETAVPGALGSPGTAVLILVGHDTNLSNLAGMLGLEWHLPGDQPDDTPPGGAVMFSLYQQPGTARYLVRTQYLAQTLEQMRSATPLTLTAPPAMQDLTLIGSEPARRSPGNSWQTFATTLQSAIDPRFVAM